MGFFDQPFKKEPHLTNINLVVHWCTKKEIEERAGNEYAYGLGQVGQNNGDTVEIWVIKPDSYNGALVEALGHELLHALGATHE